MHASGQGKLPHPCLWSPDSPSHLCPIYYLVPQKNGQNFAQLFIPRTKTSQHGIKSIVGCTSKSICAWCAMVEYLNSRHTINTSFVHTPLFMLSNHSFIHKQYLVSSTRSLIAATGLYPANFTGHSFRVGVATQPSINHIPEFHFQQLGHWKYNAYKTYIHTPIDQIVNYSNVLSKSYNKLTS